MATIRLRPDFNEFLKLLNSHGVKSPLVGGFSAGYYGYPRATGAIDVWDGTGPANADRMFAALVEFGFGFGLASLSRELFLKDDQIVRMVIPPLRIDILKKISGIEFAECFGRRMIAEIDGVPVSLVSLPDLRQNKQASGRHKDLNDLENLP
jgi:hypothetical protein